jgi:hypothetical protein
MRLRASWLMGMITPQASSAHDQVHTRYLPGMQRLVLRWDKLIQSEDLLYCL